MPHFGCFLFNLSAFSVIFLQVPEPKNSSPSAASFTQTMTGFCARTIDDEPRAVVCSIQLLQCQRLCSARCALQGSRADIRRPSCKSESSLLLCTPSHGFCCSSRQHKCVSARIFWVRTSEIDYDGQLLLSFLLGIPSNICCRWTRAVIEKVIDQLPVCVEKVFSLCARSHLAAAAPLMKNCLARCPYHSRKMKCTSNFFS